MDGKLIARVAATVFVALAITASAIEMTRKEQPLPVGPDRIQEIATDPLRARQRRCQRLGELAARDPECLAVWSETRDRFLGRTSPSAMRRTRPQ